MRALALFLLALFPIWAQAACDRPTRLRFSFVPEGVVQRDTDAFRPLLDHLQVVLGMPVEVVTPASYGTVIEGLLAGAVDMARLGPASYISATRNDPSIIPFATYSVKAGAFQPEGSTYYSLLVTRTKRPYKNIQSLRGTRLALVDPESTSGAVIPRKLFARALPMPLDAYFGRVGYAGSHDAAIAAVISERADAAFVSSLHLASMVRSGKAKAEDFRVLWRSPPIPVDPFVFRGKLCPEIREKIRMVFFQQNRNLPDGTLSNIDAVQFLPAQDSDFDIIRNLR